MQFMARVNFTEVEGEKEVAINLKEKLKKLEDEDIYLEPQAIKGKSFSFDFDFKDFAEVIAFLMFHRDGLEVIITPDGEEKSDSIENRLILPAND